MTIDPEALLGWQFPVIEVTYDWRDSILYALGLGLGADPTDPAQLRFLYEDGLQAFPTMGLVLGHPGPWYRDPRTGIDWVRTVQGEQDMVLHQPLRPADRLRCETRVTDVIDKGPGRAAHVHWSRTLSRVETGEPLCTLASVLVCRGDGGFGGPTRATAPRAAVPDDPPTATCDLPISPRAALIYRLSGDLNPVHVDPAVARSAGFDRPILHGLCTLGVAAHALLRTFLDMQPHRLTGLSTRFTAPVLPGDTLRTQMWPRGSTIAFRSMVVERNVVVLDGGIATVDGGTA